MNKNYDITSIEETMREAVRGLKISDKVYCNRPQAVPESVSDFVVVKVSGQLRDLSAIGRCSIGIHLFAKNVNNIKNGKKLSVMQQKLTEGLKGGYGNILIGTNPNILGDSPDDFGFHARTILFNNVTIKSV